MKRIFQILAICILTSLMPIQVFAQTFNWDSNVQVKEITEKSIISNSQMSRVLGSVRGRLLSSAGLQISDEGNGVLGVYADTLCHDNMKDIYLTIYLEIWDEGRKDWKQINSYEYEWHASNPEENLSVVMVSFDILGLARGREYRLRSMHAARSYDNITEAMMPRTTGILLE